MASIPLRSYNREIEGLIDGNQIEEAVAHCRHILQSFPKHIGTYRLLGKAFLETQRYGDAADVFQRVLSAVPEDFVAHVGMSIIREDESNLDAAIWHMERAFEAQPSNAAIQDELRRLYGRRDGLEPPKVRLTRGALARMYAKGDLYQQAIGELRAALAEDPQRADLQTLLAQVYHLTGLRVEAVEMCSTLLKKLPNCLEANRLLAIILPDTERKEDTQIYRQRVVTLDPYYAHTGPRSLTSDGVPDNAINLERYAYKPGQQAAGGAAGQPTWASSLGIAFEQTGGGENLPEWLSPEGKEKPALAEGEGAGLPAIPAYTGGGENVFAWDEKPSEPKTPDWLSAPTETPPSAEAAAVPAEDIPDWMKQAGWGPSTGAAEEGPVSFDEETPPVETGPAHAELPDWLKDMAPSGMLEDAGSGEPSEAASKEETLPWLQEKQPGESDTIINWLGEKKEEAAPQSPEPPGGEIPDWLRDFSAPPPSIEPELPQAAAESPTADLPDWLGEAPSTAAPVAAEPAAPGMEIPDWLKGFEAEEPPIADAGPAADIVDQFKTVKIEYPPAGMPIPPAAEAAPAEDIPDWLKAMEAEAPVVGETPVVSQETPAIPAEDVPDWLKAMEAETPAEGKTIAVSHETPTAPPPGVLESEDAALAWLEGLAAKQGVPQEELITSPEERSTISPVEAAAPAEEIPDWLKAMESEAPVVEESLVVSPETPATPAEEIPDWLKAMETESPIAEETLAEPAAEMPDWIKEMAVGAEASAPEILEVPAEAAKPEAPASEEAGLAWLESLAARQGVPQDELITKPEERPAAPPEWAQAEAPLSEIMAEELTSAETEFEVPDWLKAAQPPEVEKPVAEVHATPVEELPDWLRGMEIEPPAAEMPAAPVEAVAIPGEIPAAEVPAIPAEGLPDWLSAIGAATPVEAELPAVPTEAALPAEEIPDWLKAVESEAPAVAEVSAAPAEEIPDWLKAMEVEAEAAEAPTAEIPAAPVAAEAPAVPEGEDAALAWLESLAAKQGVPQEELITKPEERPETLPEWAQEAPAVAETPAAPAEEIPDWLKAMEVEAEAAEAPTAEIPAAPVAAEAPAVPEGEEAALAWLESLAAKQGVPQEELITKPEERPEGPPAWVQEIPEAPAEAPALPVELSAIEQPPVAEEIELPDWLKAAEEIPSEEMAGTMETPAWLEEAAQPPAADAEYVWLPTGEAEKQPVEAEITEAKLPKLDINTASLAELERLPGIGFVLAQSIIAYRETYGPFASVEDLEKISGIGPVMIEEMKDLITAVPAEAKPVKKVTRPLIPFRSDEAALSQARETLSQGDTETACGFYTNLIKKNQNLDEIIHDLQEALYHHPVDILVWQTLGDAHLHNNQLQEALDAYSKAEDLLR